MTGYTTFSILDEVITTAVLVLLLSPVLAILAKSAGELVAKTVMKVTEGKKR